MKYLSILSLLGVALAEFNPANYKTVDQATYDELERQWIYAISAIGACRYNVQNAPIDFYVDENKTDTQAFIAHNDEHKEIIISIRGTSSQRDIQTDLDVYPLNYTVPGFPEVPCTGCQVHRGFGLAYNSIADIVLNFVQQLHTANPDYTIKTTSHGSLAALAYAHLAVAFPNAKVISYAYGEPQTGNKEWVAFIDKLSGNGERMNRVTYEADGVPRILTGIWVHHAREIWQRDPPRPNNTYICPGDFDPDCNFSRNGTGINADHLNYFHKPYGYALQYCDAAYNISTSQPASYLTTPSWAPGLSTATVSATGEPSSASGSTSTAVTSTTAKSGSSSSSAKASGSKASSRASASASKRPVTKTSARVVSSQSAVSQKSSQKVKASSRTLISSSRRQISSGGASGSASASKSSSKA